MMARPSPEVGHREVFPLDTLALLPSSSQSSPQVDAVVPADNDANEKTGIDYRGDGEVTVSYSGKRVVASPWPAFHQAPRNVTVFSMALRQRQKAERSGGHPKEEGDKEWRASGRP
ncbi:hypothetical protein E2562_005189 [Oryza meyeriana var. granulata]|uniref:Uncharacterized protein n=1 Tax=Oryza meyeriana var. granulata TaxID=110450 RepID=A0A6G1BTX6_9ORYZ|nr:hypothetical protein E2562_005189 [Oryza meyeriana var. granulata]